MSLTDLYANGKNVIVLFCHSHIIDNRLLIGEIMSSSILPGYQLHITSWEGDADVYKTQIISGLTKPDVNFYLSMAKQFKSKNNHPLCGLGNGAVSGPILTALVQRALDAHLDISPEVRDLWTIDPEYDECQTYETLCEMVLGNPENEHYHEFMFFCRVFASFKVFYFETPAENVTAEFI